MPPQPLAMTCEAPDILLKKPIVTQDGYVAIPQMPFPGGELNIEVVQQYAL